MTRMEILDAARDSDAGFKVDMSQSLFERNHSRETADQISADS